MASPNHEALMRELLATFQVEAVEHVDALNQALLQLERQPEDDARRDLLGTAFRAAHSLKGASRAVSLPEIEGLSHEMESVLQIARDENAVLRANTCDVLYDTLDAIQALLDGKSPPLESLHERLVALGEDGTKARATAKKTTKKAAKQTNGQSKPAPESIPEPAVAAPAPSNEEEGALASLFTAEETIRVSIDKLDNLMAQAGELVVSRISTEQRLVEMQALRREMEQWPRFFREMQGLVGRLDDEAAAPIEEVLDRQFERLQTFTRDVETLNRVLGQDASRLGMVSNQIQDEVRRVRMVPFQQLVLTVERALRDAAHSEDKQVDLRVQGGDVEMDKKVLEMLKDPLMHLIRNAVSHGIELPAEREAKGKPAKGTVHLVVQQRGSEVRITVSDDGRGFDLEGLRIASATNGGPRLDDNAGMDEVISLAFIPGMTTSKKVTAMSGRGVGLDVVRQHLETLQGRIEVESAAGAGATFQLVVPQSLTMTRGLLIQVHNRQYILPLLSVQKIAQPDEIFNVEGQPMLMVDDVPLPLVPLAGPLGLPLQDDVRLEDLLAVVLGVAEQRIALLVDDVLIEQEVAVKSLGLPLKRVRNVAGAALLGSGQPVIVLNPADLVKSMRSSANSVLFIDSGEDEQSVEMAHILVVDDSITTRTLEKNILEAAGYRVTIATDGTEALQRLDENEDIALVVSDIQMPIMDGIALASHLRGTDEYHEMPIILVTSLESQEDRESGMHAGANAYIVKRGFDQAELLATITHYLS